MQNSYPFPTYSGLLEPKHYKQIGSAIWLFLWCISSTTKEEEREGVTWGIVLGGKPVKSEEIAEKFGVNEKTVRRWIESLETHGYISVTRTSNGMTIEVRNSKKFADKNVRSDRTKMSDHDERPDKNVRSDRTEMSDQVDKNVRSKKDITEINNNTTTAASLDSDDEIFRQAQEIERHFLQRRGKGNMVSPSDFAAIRKMLADGIPVDLIKECIDRSFAEFKPKHVRDEIRTITYCIPRCYDEWTKRNAPITDAVPHVSVALGGHRKNRLQIANEKLLREIMEAEERDRNRSAEVVPYHPEHI